MTLDAAVAAVRGAVRPWLTGAHLPPGDKPGDAPVVVACSGGADSLALLAACVSESTSRPVLGVVVDHGLQEGSAEHTARVVAQMAEIGADETVSVTVHVEAAGQGPEAAAREARYDVLEEVAQRLGAAVVLLGHTLDDQAETVLLGLTRGSGGRSIAGMRTAFGPFARPLLAVRREQTEAACRAQGITWWSDPHNEDPRFTRVRVRTTVLPTLERELGPGVAETLARTAEQLRPDMEALDELADDAWARLRDAPAVRDLAALPPALLSRVVRLAALEAGAVGSELFHVHVLALVALVRGELRGRGGGEVQLPGHVTAYRAAVSGGPGEARLAFRRTGDAGSPGATP